MPPDQHPCGALPVTAGVYVHAGVVDVPEQMLDIIASRSDPVAVDRSRASRRHREMSHLGRCQPRQRKHQHRLQRMGRLQRM